MRTIAALGWGVFLCQRFGGKIQVGWPKTFTITVVLRNERSKEEGGAGGHLSAMDNYNATAARKRSSSHVWKEWNRTKTRPSSGAWLCICVCEWMLVHIASPVIRQQLRRACWSADHHHYRSAMKRWALYGSKGKGSARWRDHPFDTHELNHKATVQSCIQNSFDYKKNCF